MIVKLRNIIGEGKPMISKISDIPAGVVVAAMWSQIVNLILKLLVNLK